MKNCHVPSTIAMLPGRQAAHRAVVVVHGDADLLEVVDALGPPRGLARRLDRRQQQRDQHGDDGDDDQSSISVKPRR